MRLIFWLASATAMFPATQPWDLVGDIDPALWSHSRSALPNPDPNANPLLRQAPALLSVQCQDGRRLAFVNHNFEVEAGSATVSTSLDDGPATTETWSADTDIALRPPDVIVFVARLRGHQRLRMTVTWPGAAPTSTEFDVTGIEAALKPLHAACGW